VATIRQYLDGYDVECIRVEAPHEWNDLLIERWGQYGLPYQGHPENAPAGVLDHEHCAGFGRAQVPRWMAWTPTQIIVYSEYDGATGADVFPRHPGPMGEL